MTRTSTKLSYSLSFALVSFVIGVVVTVVAFRLSPAAKSNLIEFPDALPSVTEDTPSKRSESYATEKVNTPAVDERYTRMFGVRTFDDTAQLSSAFDKKVAIYYRLALASKSEILELLEESKSIRRHSERETVQTIIFARFAAIDPHGALDYVEQINLSLHRDLIDTIFGEWARSDLEKAVATAEGLSGTRRAFAIQAILRARDDLPLGIRSELAENLGGKHYLNELASQSQFRETLADPRTEWNRLIETSKPTSVRKPSFMHIASVWFQSEGTAAVSEIINSLAHSKIREEVLPAVIEHIATPDPNKLLDILQEMPLENDVVKFIPRVLGRWAWDNVDAAFARATDLDVAYSTYENRAAVIDVWIYSDPESVLNVVDSLPAELVNSTLSQAISRLALRSPAKAVSYWSDINNLPLKRKLTSSIVSNWNKSDPKAATEWLLTQPEELANDRRKAATLVALAGKDLDLALNISSRQHGDLGILLDSEIISSIAAKNTDQAINLLSHIESDSRLTSALKIGQTLIFEDHARALGIGKILNEDQKSEYYDQLVSIWARSRPQEVINKLDELPSNSLTATTARNIIQWDQYMNKKLTQEQYNYLFSRLSEEDQRTYRR